MFKVFAVVFDAYIKTISLLINRVTNNNSTVLLTVFQSDAASAHPRPSLVCVINKVGTVGRPWEWWYKVRG